MISVPAVAGNASGPLGEPALEAPTLRSLGAHWIIRGDDNRNASISVAYRQSGSDNWKKGFPLFRVERGLQKNEEGYSDLDVPEDAWLFAGSVVLLDPDTEYELKLKLSDADGGGTEKVLKARTKIEPVAPSGMREIHVAPGNGSGDGSRTAPLRGLASAQASAKPGDLFLLHAGIYEGPFWVTQCGEPGKPMIWRGAGDGETVIDAQGSAEKRPGRGICANDTHDVWFENLTIRNADYGFVGHDACRIVIRRCRIHGVEYGITNTRNSQDHVRDWFISDNIIQGPSTWPRTKGIENARGIQITGTGHTVCYNRITGFADALDTFPSGRCSAIDFHNNEISEMTDDGIEMDYSFRNTRCFFNRFTDIFQGISTQPVYGGPVYIFRNVMYNVVGSPFKMHNNPSGALMFHNTCVKRGMPMVCYGGPRVGNFIYRNNIFIGTTANYAFESTAKMENCDFDCDGFGGGPWTMFLKWNEIRYPSLAEVHKQASVYKKAVLLGTASIFKSGAMPPDEEAKQFDAGKLNLRLNGNNPAIDAGEILPGFNDDFTGLAPDLGAYEVGMEIPHYGPRPF